VILRNKTGNLRHEWGANVLENHAQKLRFLSKIGHIGHCGLGRVDFERNPIKLPLFTHGAHRAKGALSLIDACGSNDAREVWLVTGDCGDYNAIRGPTHITNMTNMGATYQHFLKVTVMMHCC